MENSYQALRSGSWFLFTRGYSSTRNGGCHTSQHLIYKSIWEIGLVSQTSHSNYISLNSREKKPIQCRFLETEKFQLIDWTKTAEWKIAVCPCILWRMCESMPDAICPIRNVKWCLETGELRFYHHLLLSYQLFQRIAISVAIPSCNKL